jgi:phage terminase large subunit GpA-like protein
MRTIYNAPERALLGSLFKIFQRVPAMSTIDWAKKYRLISKKETSFGEGKFDANLTPYMEYVYDCLDNPRISTIVAKKSARIGWTETINNYRGKRIHVDPTTMLLGFPTLTAAKIFAKEKWRVFIENVPVLRTLVNQGIAENKKSFYDYDFPGGHLRLSTLGSITNQKSSNLEYIEVEEPDDAPDDVSGQGDTFANLKERQKLVPLIKRKFIFGGTPTFKDFSRVESAIKASNWMIFKAECHNCAALVPMDGSSFNNLVYDVYPNKKIDEIYGVNDPDSAKFICPHCAAEWTFEQKNANIIAGKKYGFTDHTGNFSKGWHPKNEGVIDTFGFDFSEMLCPFSGSSFVEMAKARILAERELAIGKELLMKSFVNNKMGEPYSSGFNAMEPEEMRKYRRNYQEGVVPMEAVIAFAGIDVQDNRFAYVIRAWGRDGTSYLVKWEEIYGNTLNGDDKIWDELARRVVTVSLPHASGKEMPVTMASIDSAFNTELVYRFVYRMHEDYPGVLLCCRGVKDLRFSEDEIYREPSMFEIATTAQYRRTLAERLGVTVYHVGTHKAHGEILRRMMLAVQASKSPENYRSDIMYWNDQSYGGYEEQIVSCRKIFTIDHNGNTKENYKLIPGKRKEAIDCEKLALHAAIAHGIRQYTPERYAELERYYWS